MVWTLQEANEALPLVRRMLATARGILDRAREAQQHVEDLRIVHGPGVAKEDHPAYHEWQGYAAGVAAAKQELRAALEDFRRAGVEPKDLEMGLVDFPARHGDEVVFLCWREGEERIEAWHPIEGGFASRRPVPEIQTGV